jgi:hypothetical protein
VHLAQLELAPNLRVQTGPVGGGDAKADIETYPVSELMGIRFYDSEGNSSEESMPDKDCQLMPILPLIFPLCKSLLFILRRFVIFD